MPSVAQATLNCDIFLTNVPFVTKNMVQSPKDRELALEAQNILLMKDFWRELIENSIYAIRGFLKRDTGRFI